MIEILDQVQKRALLQKIKSNRGRREEERRKILEIFLCSSCWSCKNQDNMFPNLRTKSQEMASTLHTSVIDHRVEAYTSEQQIVGQNTNETELPCDSLTKRLEEALKKADDISIEITQSKSLYQFPGIVTEITNLGSTLSNIETDFNKYKTFLDAGFVQFFVSLLKCCPIMKFVVPPSIATLIEEKEKLETMISDLRTRTKDVDSLRHTVESTLRDQLGGSMTSKYDAFNSQKKIITEQDEALDKLSDSTVATKGKLLSMHF